MRRECASEAQNQGPLEVTRPGDEQTLGVGEAPKGYPTPDRDPTSASPEVGCSQNSALT